MDHYYDSLIQLRGVENMKGTGYRPYLRWKLYWSQKVGTDGSITSAQNAIFSYSNNFTNLNSQLNKSAGNWQELGPFVAPYDAVPDSSGMAGVGRVHALAFDPNNQNRVFALTPYWGGLYRSDNYGQSWTRIQTDDVEGESAGCLVVDYTDYQKIYLVNEDVDGYKPGSFGPTGIYRTGDSGGSWKKIVDFKTSQRHQFVRKLIMDPNNNDRLLMAADFGLYIVTNLAANHADTINKLVNTRISDIEYKPGSNNIVYASGERGTFLYYSTNDGGLWDSIPSPVSLKILPDGSNYHTNIEVSAAASNLIYLLINGANGSATLYIYNTTDSTWLGNYDLPYMKVTNFSKGFAVSPANANIIYAGDNNNKPIYKSVDMGQTWQPLSTINYHIDIHHLDFSNTNQLWAATDGGIHRMNNDNTWSDLTNMSISNTDDGSFAASQSDTNLVLSGCADVGSLMYDKSHAGTNKWSQKDGGDGTACVFDPVDATTYYTSILGGTITRHDNKFPYVHTLYPVINFMKQYHCLVVDAGNHNTIYLITDSAVFRSNQKGDDGTWKRISNNLNTGNSPRKFHRLFTSETTPGVLYLRNGGGNGDYTYYRTFNANDLDNNSVTWDNIDNIDNSVILDLVVDPRNPKYCWATLQGWDNPKKVMRLTKNGWENITYNLHNVLHVPGVKGLAFDRMSPLGRLYVGTQDGVFYLEEGDTTWVLFDGIPEADITNLKLQYLSGKLYASTWGKGVWQASVNNPLCEGITHISRDTTISHGALSLCDIMIDSLCTMTINGCLTMGLDTKIMIHQGAKLILDGGTITGYNNQMWKGIEVYGRSNKSQSPPSNQGWFKALNNAIVENAVAGVATIEGNNYTHTGGIIQANKTTFRNCTQAVAFYAFENRHPTNGSVVNNNSNFGNCTFEINNNYAGADTIRNIVSLDQIRGIKFVGCRFVNYCTSALATKPVGIFSFNSSFLVYSLLNCNVYPCFDTIHSEFSKLGYGIRALGAATTKTFKVYDAIFTENKNIGIYTSGIDYITLIRNKFNIIAVDTTITKPYGGAYFSQCKSYVIEENLYRKLSGSGVTVGLTINNSGPYNNQVYKNTLTNLNVGILAQNRNKDYQNDNVGLCFRCNIFSNNRYDIAVTAPATMVSDTTHYYGVSLAQGSLSYPAGNLFTPSSYTPLVYNLYNLNVPAFHLPDPPDITYYYHIEDQYNHTIPEKRTNVTLPNPTIPYSDSTCQSHLGGGINPADKLASANADVMEQQALLSLLIDGGETEATASEVVYALPAEALELRDNLLQKSPYLSDTVMKEAIENESVLNNALLRDVLVANPQSAKSADLMQAVEERIDPMPDYMQDEIESGANVISPKEHLENELAMARSEANGWYNRRVGDMLHDTAGIDTDALYNLLESRPSPSNEYFRALELLERGDSLTGFEALAEIPSTFNYDQGQLAEHTLIVENLFMLHPILFSGISAKAIDSLAAASLLEEYNNGGIYNNCWLRNTLTAIGKLDFVEEYFLPDNLKATEATIPQTKIVNHELLLKVFPNPAKDYMIIEYHVTKTGNCVIKIADEMGRPVDQIPVFRDSDQLTYITAKLDAGFYTCSLWIEGRNKASVKFNVIR